MYFPLYWDCILEKHCFYYLRIDFIKLYFIDMSLLHSNYCFSKTVMWNSTEESLEECCEKCYPLSFTAFFLHCRSYCLMCNLHCIIEVKEIDSEAKLPIFDSQLPALLLCDLGSYLASLCLSFLINKIRTWAMRAEIKVPQIYTTLQTIICNHPHIRVPLESFGIQVRNAKAPVGSKSKEQFWEGSPCPGVGLTYGSSEYRPGNIPIPRRLNYSVIGLLSWLSL